MRQYLIVLQVCMSLWAKHVQNEQVHISLRSFDSLLNLYFVKMWVKIVKNVLKFEFEQMILHFLPKKSN